VPKTSHFFTYITINITLILILSSSICSDSLFAQVYSSDQNPPSLQWRQINTNNFQLIYPLELEQEAQRITSVLESIVTRERRSIQVKPKKISIILQNQGVTSNGFVELAPRRSEFYTTPSQSFDFQSWLNSLAIHEMRHVVQFDKLTGRLNAPFFEQLALAVFGITLPPWFFEGDAVVTETALTDAGRGRIPEWSIALRANTLSDRKFSYSKNYLGSVKDFTPGYYQLGFFMTSKLRKDYGKDVMEQLFSRMTSQPFRPYNLSNSVKKLTGMSTRQLHDSTISELRRLWQNQVDLSEAHDYPSLNKRRNTIPENYLMPQTLPNGDILAMKQSKASTPRIVRIDASGNEKKVVEIGYQELPWFSYGGGKITWDEHRFEGRFHQRSYNVINVFDTLKRRSRQITKKTRLFAPSLSPEGNKILAISISYSNEISLVEIDARSGRELRQFKSPNNDMLQMPAYRQDAEKAVVVAVNDSGKTLLELDLKSGNFAPLLPYQKQEILRPVYAEGSIFFKAHYNGIDNLYRLDLSDRRIFQVSSAKLGAFNPFYDTISKKMTFNTYTPLGYDIAALNADSLAGIPLENIGNHFVDYGKAAYEQEGGRSLLYDIIYKTYPSTRYKEWQNLFNFHSVIPTLEDNPFFNDSNFGVEIQSDNLLNTMSFYTGYQFNNALRKSEYSAGFAYKRFFPILSVHYINRPRLIYRRAVSNNVTTYTPVTWRENEVKAEVSVPLSFNRFNHTYGITFKTGTSLTNRYDFENRMPSLLTRLDFPMHYQLALSHNSRRSARDLVPRWGQNVTLTYRHFPFEDRVEGQLFVFRSTLYFPGLTRNHSFAASFNFQDGDGNYQNSVDIPRVSGYSFLKPLGNTHNTLLLNYRMPVFYPDWELGPLAYIKRVKLGLFADFENVGHGRTFSPRSFGAELRGDMNLLRFYLPNFDIGGKVVFLNEKPSRKPIFETIATYSF